MFVDMKAVGETPLFQVPQLSGRYGADVWVKDESKNKYSGTHKDRRNYSVLLRDSMIHEPIYYIQISKGNSALSLTAMCSDFSQATGFERRTINLVPKDTPRYVTKAIRDRGGIVVKRRLDTPIPNHTLVEVGREILGYDALVRTVESSTEHGTGYVDIAEEILADGLRPMAVFCPVGSGELLLKLERGFDAIGYMPLLVGCTVPENIFARDADFDATVGRSVADKLVTPYSNVRLLVEQMFDEGHLKQVVSDAEIIEEMEVLDGLKIITEPSAAAAFAGARKYSQEVGFLRDEPIVIINTGYGLHANKRALGSYLSKAAAALLVGSLASVPSGVNQSTRELKWIEDGRKYYLEQQSKELASNPIMSEIIAYSLWRGSMEKIDRQVLGDLEYWHLSNDMIARIMYNDAKHTRFRDNVDGFGQWRRDQKKKKEEAEMKYREAMRQMIEGK